MTANFGGLWKLIPCDTYLRKVSRELGIQPAVRGVSLGVPFSLCSFSATSSEASPQTNKM
jgi:hypothetical protein